MGQSNEIIAQFGRLAEERSAGPLAEVRRQARDADGDVGVERDRAQLSRRARRLADAGRRPIFDGYLLTSTLGNTPLPIVDVPIDADADADRSRDVRRAGQRISSRATATRRAIGSGSIEVAGMPHNNSRENPGFLNDPCTLPVTDFPAGAFTALGLQLPHRRGSQTA